MKPPPTSTRPDATSELREALALSAHYREQLDYLMDIGGLLRDTEIDVLLLKILERTTDYLDADVASITLFDAAGAVQRTIEWGLPSSVLTEVRHRDGRRALDVARTERTSLLWTAEDLAPVLGGMRRIGTLLILPLVVEQRVLGSINVVAPVDSAARLQAALEIVQPGIDLAAVALENAQLLLERLQRQRDLEQLALAQQIQRRLLPLQAPNVSGLQIDSEYVSASQIGGDYFDYLRFEDGGFGIVVADVAGKGPAAGLVMTAVRAMVRSAVRTTSAPGTLLQRVNEQLCQENLQGVFVTALAVRVEPQVPRLVIASAGHVPALVVAGDGPRFVDFTPARLPLGVDAGHAFPDVEVRVSRGDLFVLCTDGITEAMDETSHAFGLDGLQRAAGTLGDLHPTTALRTLLRTVADFVGDAEPHDDTTLIVGRLVATGTPEVSGPPHA